MRAGRLDRKINIQVAVSTQDEFGQEISDWSNITDYLIDASISPLRGEERFSSERFIALEQVEFRIRWSQDVEDVNPLHRIVYPGSADSPATPGTPTIYNIMAVHELGRRQGLKILAARRAEQ